MKNTITFLSLYLKKVLDKVNRNKRIQTNQSYKTLTYKQKMDSIDECQSS